MNRLPTTQVGGYAVTVECDSQGTPFRAIARAGGRVMGIASTADDNRPATDSHIAPTSAARRALLNASH